MVEGTLAEEHIRALWTLDHKDLVVKKPPKKGGWLFRRKDEPMMTCTPDGLVYDIDKRLYGLEIKDCELIKKEDKEMWETGYLPDQYYCQLLWYLVVMSDMQGVYLTAHLKYFTNVDGKWVFDYAVDRTYFIERNQVLNDIKYLEDKGKSFIHDNFEKRIRPKLTIKI